MPVPIVPPTTANELLQPEGCDSQRFCSPPFGVNFRPSRSHLYQCCIPGTYFCPFYSDCTLLLSFSLILHITTVFPTHIAHYCCLFNSYCTLSYCCLFYLYSALLLSFLLTGLVKLTNSPRPTTANELFRHERRSIDHALRSTNRQDGVARMADPSCRPNVSRADFDVRSCPQFCEFMIFKFPN